MKLLTEPCPIDRDAHDSAWHDTRRLGIGGSDSAAVLGESHWRTPYAVWRQKLGLDGPGGDSDAMRAGRLIEPVLRQEYSDRYGRNVYDPGWRAHPDLPFVVGNVDGLCSDRVLEIKTAHGAEWEEGEVPIEYYFQVQHYMLLFDKPQADIFALFGGQKIRCYNIKADVEVWEYMIDIYARFWRHVEDETPPELTTLSDVNRAYRQSVETSIVLSREAVDAISQIANIRQEMKELEMRAEELELAVKRELGKSEAGTDDNGRPLVTWKIRKPRETFDASRFRLENPELYNQYVVEGSVARPFLLKKIKGVDKNE